ncbi:MAG: cupin domain-containing protein [Sphingomonas sp.]
MSSARDLIARLNLAPHPEGGWYRETWRAPAAAGERASATAILFLLESGGRSHWHRVDAAELWLWHAGAPLTLSMAASEAGPIEHHRLGGDVAGGEAPQLLVPPHHWQAATADRGWTLVSCVVSPGFDFAGFDLAAPGWAPGADGQAQPST